jgi:predicted ABC-type transport system involved in lysophospholipase L1 biosynthesis ATPase subunit
LTARQRLRESLATCRDVSVEFGDGDATVRALSAVSLEVGNGERIALLGRSGSGKTTLLHVLGGLITPSSGMVEWRGRPIGSAARDARGSRRISYVFQGSNLLPHFTAFENVAFAAQLAPGAAHGAVTAPSLLGLVGLGAKLDHLPAELSGGEAQRVAIARALSQQPELLLCDEPTGHLDTDTGERILDLIDALQGELGFAIVVATHDSDVAARFDREVELDDGTVVREGTAS